MSQQQPDQQRTSTLAGLPSRGCMGVVDGYKPLPSGPGPAYICCQQPSAQVLVHNPAVRLIDLYRLSARKRAAGSTAPTAAAATAAVGFVSGIKRPAAGQPPQEDGRAGAKRQQQQAGKEAAAPAPAAAALLAIRRQPQQQRPAQPQQLQQQRGAAAPLAALPNATNLLAAAAAPGLCSASKQLLAYSPEQMLALSNKALAELLKGCGLKVGGRKEDLVRRLMEHQRRVRKAASGGGAAGAPRTAGAART